MTVQNFLTISNLQETPAAIFCRKFSFYASLFFNFSILLILLILCNLGVEIEFDCRPVFGDCHIVPMKEQEILKDIKIFNTICLVVMSMGALSLMLDMVHKRICSAVFNVPAPEKPCEKPNEKIELEMMLSTKIEIAARV